ncbi:hypothetical protein QC764_202730 [Podospora pseudoanserina]|uniref:Rhomboid-type serine protease n=1 Tax=Podospora pseudoanserina TaxID=2609844 RepID=A0ABR0IFS1_9PEZI|nr:hypothetical protein QC764_202730 [Podospora pseudoanserina]
MASNEYYSQTSRADNQYYGGNDQYRTESPSAYSAPAPAYSSHHNLVGPGKDRPPAAQGVSPSPFETVFDDHVYPAAPSSSHQARRLSQQDTSYRPLSRVPSDEMPAYNHAPDDIPLQDNMQKHPSRQHIEMQDHVYDTSSSQHQQPPNKPPSKGRVRLGELGMLGSGKKKIPFVVYFFTIVQVAVFIGELVKNGTSTGSPIMIKPQFNPMIGPSPYILINMGARFVPCMHNVKAIQEAEGPVSWPCPWSTTNENTCTLSELCGFGGVQQPGQPPEPNQWFRFIVPIFLHAGLIHIGFNMLLQLTLGRDMEKHIGSIRFFIVYMSAGIFGFVMGGNFAATGIASTGASGSLFGIIALTFLDLLYSWKDRVNPTKDLMYLFIDIIISFVLGLLPGLDNFSHIGGFLMGLALGICILHSPNSLRRRIGESDVPYANSQVSSGFLKEGTVPPFFKNPVGFFKGRKPLWWGWWLIRVGALILVLVVFVLLLNNFYIHHKPVNNWCELGNLTITRDQETAQQQQAAKRAVEALMGMSRRVLRG